MNGQAWTSAEQFDAMDATTEQTFGDLINFDHLDLDLSEFNYGNGDISNALQDFTPQIPQHHHNDAPAGQQPQNTMGGHSMPQPTNGFTFDYAMGQYSQAGTPVYPLAQEHAYQPHQGVPPTPNSVEMHGDPHRYMQHMASQQALFDQRFHMRKDDATFTPLVSPAVTPHDARFQIPDFTVPGAYFSPLTSPALNAQNNPHAHQHSQNTTSGSSTGHSPIDVDMEGLGEPMMQQETGRKLRSTNKRNAPRSANGSNRVRQSPIVKPGRRKATVSSFIPPKEVSELMQEARGGRTNGHGLDVPYSRETSETDSISPEPMLSEMRPPPKPSSLTASPAMIAQMNGHGTPATPATPASLMRIQASPNFSDSNDMPIMMDDLTLPEASLDRPTLSRLDTAVLVENENTPRLAARKTPKLSAISTPGAGLSGRPSPMMEASTPTSPAFTMTNGRRPDPKGGRQSKKRNSVCSTLVSPALRPKISPSIKPLLPDAGSSSTDNTHALLLASKSNYQNILDGTTVPGVVYPTSLSTNLTSKRTSHKIAEQGRRNRINMALQEMQALLPSNPQLVAAAVTEAKSPESAAAQSSNSKAAKVESAIDYIKQLKQEVSEKDRLIERKDVEMEMLRKEVARLKRGSSVGSGSGSGEEVGTVVGMKAEPASSPNTDVGS